jgi:hypothetical protein
MATILEKIGPKKHNMKHWRKSEKAKQEAIAQAFQVKEDCPAGKKK